MTMVCMSTGLAREVLQGGQGHGLPLAHGPADHAHGGVGVPVAQEDIHHCLKLPVPFFALGIVEDDDKIARGNGGDPALDDLPGGQEIA